MKKSKGISLDKMSGTYDFLVPTEKSKFRQKQIGLLHLKDGESVLDCGCGTGILTVLAKIGVGSGNVAGIDIAPKMIEKSKNKAEKYNLDIEFKTASIDNLPFENETFDAVISSWSMHHLPVNVKKNGLKEIYRVLKKNGRFLLSDWGKPHYFLGYIGVLFFIWMKSTRVQFFGKLPFYLKEVGFKKIKLVKKGLFMEHYLVNKK